MNSKVETTLWAAPILPGQGEMWRRFCQVLMASRRPEYVASRHRLGICREEAWWVPSAQSALAVVSLSTTKPEKVWSTIHTSKRPFDRWYRRQLRQIHGPTLIQSLVKKQSERLYRWQASDAIVRFR